MVLIKQLLLCVVEKVSASFRPLAGIMVLIKAGNLPTDETSHCFRPLAGIMVLIDKPLLEGKVIYYDSFRPLAGIMVLIGLVTGSHRLAALMFPSPCGDYGSYPNKNSCKESF